jgi:xylulokinase
LARAVLEGCAFAMRDVIERLRELGVACRSILLLGGGARSRLWGQIRADVAGLPVEVPANVNSSPAGAALLAAVAAGIYPHIGAAARQLERKAARLEPDPLRHTRYDAAYGRYRQLFESLKPMFAAAP